MAIWGVANPWSLPAIYAPANDITLTAGSEILAITTTGALTATPGQPWVPVISGCAILTLGATAPTALVIAARYSGGYDFATQTIAVGLLANLAVLMVPILLIGASAVAASNGAVGGAAIEITGRATTTDATWTKVGTQLTIQLIPGQ